MFARLGLFSETPSLILEEIEDLLVNVQCQKHEIELMILPQAFASISQMIDSVEELFLVTSHEGAANGVADFLIAKIEFSTNLFRRVRSHTRSRPTPNVVLSVEPAPQKYAFKTSLEFRLLSEDKPRLVRRSTKNNEGLEPRQASAATTSGGSTAIATVGSSATALSEDFSFSDQRIWLLSGEASL